MTTSGEDAPPILDALESNDKVWTATGSTPTNPRAYPCRLLCDRCGEFWGGMPGAWVHPRLFCQTKGGEWGLGGLVRILILMATRRRVPKQDPGNARSRGSESLRTAKRRQQRERAAVRKQKEHRKLDWLLDKYARGWRKRTRTAGPVPVTGLQGVTIDIARLIAEFDPYRARLEVRLQIKLDEFKQLRSGGVFYWFRPLRTARFRFASGTGILGKISAVSTVAAALCNGDAQQVSELLMATRCPRDGIRVRVIARTSGCMCLVPAVV